MSLSSQLYNQLKDNIGSESFENVNKFMHLYVRFESTLCKMGKIHNGINADWSYFDGDIQNFDLTNNELNQSIKYLIQSPPKKMVSNNGQLDWQSLNFDNLSDSEKILKSIKTIRNNYMHGSKYPFDKARDTKLIECALIILDEILETTKEDFKNKINEELNPE